MSGVVVVVPTTFVRGLGDVQCGARAASGYLCHAAVVHPSSAGALLELAAVVVFGLVAVFLLSGGFDRL